MNPGNSSWLPWTSSKRGLRLYRELIWGLKTRRKSSTVVPAAILPLSWCRHPRPTTYLVFCPHIQSNRARATAVNDSPRKNAVTLFSRAAILRSTSLATSLVLAAGLSTSGAQTLTKPKVPLPKPRPIARNVVAKSSPKTAVATASNTANTAPAAAVPVPVAPAIAPATRQHAALPPPPARKQVPTAVLAATSSTSQADTDALENVIELVRKHQPVDATQAEAAISDPVAKKLAEWIILRSDNNGASVERYRAFLTAHPSWPSQTFLRRRLETALWDDNPDDATRWSWV